jgi:hypothetical protein
VRFPVGTASGLIAAIGVLVAFAALLWQGCSTQREINLLNQQVIGSLRPVVVPENMRIGPDRGTLLFDLRNVAGAPSLGGVVALIPSTGKAAANESDRKRFPTCAADHGTYPVDATQISYVRFPPLGEDDTYPIGLDMPFVAATTDAWCVAAIYADAAAALWVTDWLWTNDFLNEPERVGNEPRGLRSFKVREPEWWSEDVPKLFYEP